MDPAPALAALLGPVEAVTIIETWWRPTVVVEDEGEPAPLDIPFPAGPHVLIPLPEVSFAFSGNVTVQRTSSTDGRTAIVATTRRASCCWSRGWPCSLPTRGAASDRLSRGRLNDARRC